MGPNLVQVGPDVGDVRALEPDVTLARELEQIDAPKERRLPASRGTDHDLDIAFLQDGIDASQDMVVAEPLVNALQADDRAIVVVSPHHTSSLLLAGFARQLLRFLTAAIGTH